MQNNGMRLFNIAVWMVITLFSFSAVAGVIKCKDPDGHVIYTQTQSDCYQNIETLSVNKSSVGVKSDKEKVSYRIPLRKYVHEKAKWDIYIEAALLDGNSKLYDASLNKLNVVLDEIFSKLPTKAAQQLKTLKVYLMWGENSPDGGRKNGMSYIRKGEPDNYHYLDPRWEHSLVIYSADNLDYLSDLWTRKAIMHEIAHAWHIMNWPEKHPPIYQSWQSAKSSGLYSNVKDIKGKIIKNGYAMKNQLEYFAELSAIYFAGGNYYPFNKKYLKEYDPQGYAMVESLWL